MVHPIDAVDLVQIAFPEDGFTACGKAHGLKGHDSTACGRSENVEGYGL
jgi:hypothetical protein